jgi:hypothetical protein
VAWKSTSRSGESCRLRCRHGEHTDTRLVESALSHHMATAESYRVVSALPTGTAYSRYLMVLGLGQADM